MYPKNPKMTRATTTSTQEKVTKNYLFSESNSADTDKSMKVGGLQCIITNDEYYVMPLNFINGLPFLPMRPYTDGEWTKLPHVLLTADRKWDPRVLDGNIDDIEEWLIMLLVIPQRYQKNNPGT